MTTLDLVIIFGVLLGVVVVLVVGVLRAPVMRLSSKEKEKIKQNGLIHFTKTEYIDSIQKNGLRGTISKMGFEPLLGNFVWLYLYEGQGSISLKHQELKNTGNAKKDPTMYSACLHITGFSDADIKRMHIRKFPKRWGVIGDNAIVFKGKLLIPEHIRVVFKE